MRKIATFSALLFVAVLTGCQTVGSKTPPPVTHVVLVWLKTDTTAAERADIEKNSHALTKIPGVQRLTIGKAVPSDRDIVDDSFDLALVMQFADVDAMNTYISHPDHRAYVAGIKPHVTRLQVYDLR